MINQRPSVWDIADLRLDLKRLGSKSGEKLFTRYIYTNPGLGIRVTSLIFKSKPPTLLTSSP